jgi:hypothetical protein
MQFSDMHTKVSAENELGELDALIAVLAERRRLKKRRID